MMLFLWLMHIFFSWFTRLLASFYLFDCCVFCSSSEGDRSTLIVDGLSGATVLHLFLLTFYGWLLFLCEENQIYEYISFNYIAYFLGLGVLVLFAVASFSLVVNGNLQATATATHLFALLIGLILPATRRQTAELPQTLSILPYSPTPTLFY
jgi:hypothetical protein